MTPSTLALARRVRALQDAHAANVEAFLALYRERRGG